MFPYFFPADKSLRQWRWHSHCWQWFRISLNVSQVHKEHFALFCSNVVLGAAEMAQLVKCLQSSARTRVLSLEQPGKETEPMSSHANLVGGLQAGPGEQHKALSSGLYLPCVWTCTLPLLMLPCAQRKLFAVEISALLYWCLLLCNLWFVLYLVP